MPGDNNFFLANGLLSHNSGKTCKLLTIVQGYHSKGYKVWDLFGGKREEGPFWALPNDDEKLWRQLSQETYDLKEPGPKQYQVNLLYPMFSTKLPDQLPHNSPNVKAKVFTIPWQTIEERDISLVIGPMGSNALTLWKRLQASLPGTSNGEDVGFLMDTKFERMKKEAIYNLFIEPCVTNHVFAEKNSELNIDWVAEAKQRDVVSVLCLDYIPDRFKFFFMGYILRHLLQLAMHDKIPKRNVAMFREASAFMKVQDTDKSREETTQIFRNQVTEVARYARSGLFLAMDTQDSSEVKGMIEGSEDLLGICEMPSPTSREVTCTPLKQDRRMNPHQVRYIATMPVHQICVVARGEKARILKRIQPPRCKYFKSEYGNFYSLWRREVDKWTPSGGFIDVIEARYKERREINTAKRLKHLEETQPLKAQALEEEEESLESAEADASDLPDAPSNQSQPTTKEEAFLESERTQPIVVDSDPESAVDDFAELTARFE